LKKRKGNGEKIRKKRKALWRKRKIREEDWERRVEKRKWSRKKDEYKRKNEIRNLFTQSPLLWCSEELQATKCWLRSETDNTDTLRAPLPTEQKAGWVLQLVRMRSCSCQESISSRPSHNKSLSWRKPQTHRGRGGNPPRIRRHLTSKMIYMTTRSWRKRSQRYMGCRDTIIGWRQNTTCVLVLHRTPVCHLTYWATTNKFSANNHFSFLLFKWHKFWRPFYLSRWN
jgi:hypothetical protein